MKEKILKRLNHLKENRVMLELVTPYMKNATPKEAQDVQNKKELLDEWISEMSQNVSEG